MSVDLFLLFNNLGVQVFHFVAGQDVPVLSHYVFLLVLYAGTYLLDYVNNMRGDHGHEKYQKRYDYKIFHFSLSDSTVDSIVSGSVDICKGFEVWYCFGMYEDAIANAIGLLNHANEQAGENPSLREGALLGAGYALLALALKPGESDVSEAVRRFLESPSPGGWAALQGVAGWPRVETK